MFQKRLFVGLILLILLVIITGCATTENYKDDPARFNRIASNDCIGFGHVVGSEGYNDCMVKKLREVLPRVIKAARKGDNVARPRALRICLELAKQGDTTAMYNVGYMCLEGWGGKQNADVCLEWLSTAARFGHARSAKVLSGIYSEGRYGITPDEEKSAYWGNLGAVQPFAKDGSGGFETNVDVVASPRISRDGEVSSSQVVTVDEQLSVSSAAISSEAQLEKLPGFEPEMVTIPAPDGDLHIGEIVCRAHAFTGSRFTYRVCGTKAEWDKHEDINRKKSEQFAREVDDFNRKHLGLPGEGETGHMPR